MISRRNSSNSTRQPRKTRRRIVAVGVAVTFAFGGLAAVGISQAGAASTNPLCQWSPYDDCDSKLAKKPVKRANRTAKQRAAIQHRQAVQAKQHRDSVNHRNYVHRQNRAARAAQQ